MFYSRGGNNSSEKTFESMHHEGGLMEDPSFVSESALDASLFVDEGPKALGSMDGRIFASDSLVCRLPSSVNAIPWS